MIDTPPEGRETLAGLTEVAPPTISPGKPGKTGFLRCRRIIQSNREEEDSAGGRAGEQLVLAHERAQLVALGKPDLADRVVHIAVVEADGAGYDILSYTEKSETKHVEMKTTKGLAATPFFVSPNEVRFSDTYPDTFYLYRVYEIQQDLKAAKFYVVSGSLTESFQLTPTEYRARLSLSGQ